MGISNVSSNLRPGIVTSTTRPTTPYAGQTIFETDTNKGYVWNGTQWRQTTGQMPGFKAKNSSAQTISANTLTVVTLGTEVYDNGGVFASNICTIPTGYAGKWLFIAQVAWTSANTGDNKYLYITKQATGGGSPASSDIIAAQNFMAASGFVRPKPNLSVIHDCAEGDLFKMCVDHDGSGTIQVLADGSAQPVFFQGHYLGE
jgi:hypothetical protein